MTPSSPLRIFNGCSTRQRVLAAIRLLFREHGAPPSHGQIGEAAGIAAKRVQRYVEELQLDGYLTYRPRVARSIQLVDRAAMLSDQELRLACAGRGWIVTDSPVPALASIYPVEGVADWGLQLLGKLDDIG